ncbi:MAG TPA: hypothetical protein VHA52_04690 [Candidatus Babeliaceae bacterium]|nr:hypothetical protein [Candidatus Babeliaceae bacterium]
MTTSGVSWNKVIAVCSAFGIPMISILFAVVVWGTRIDGKLTDQGDNIREIKADLRGLHGQVDTIALRQHDAALERSYQYKMQTK